MTAGLQENVMVIAAVREELHIFIVTANYIPAPLSFDLSGQLVQLDR